MTFASDQQQGLDGLSPAARRMIALRDTVFAAWEQKVRESIPQADGLRHPILIDSLPVFYDNIAQAISAGYPRTAGGDGSSLAAEHGGERARVTMYDHASLIGEYEAFRWAILHVLEREGVQLSHREHLAINAAVDAGIREAVHGFTLVHAALRERFAAALAHDMRGPLGVAVTALEVSLRTPDPDKARATTIKALENLRRMDGMISELLHSMAFAGGHPMQIDLSCFDILELIKEVQQDGATQHGPRIEVIGSRIVGWWGRASLKRALENMVSNAFKYGTPGTTVTIRASEVHGRLMLSVHNEGEPIPLDEQECVFQMYRRAQAAKNTDTTGWGIGLPYVRAVAESHGGSVALDSTRERGTTLLIDISVDCRGLQQAPTLA